MTKNKMLIGSIDLSKIDKNRVVTTDNNGNPFKNGGKYLNVVVWVNEEPDNYGNIASIQESVSKEERESGVKGTYIGNLKSLDQNQPNETNKGKEEDSGLPF